MGVNVHKLSARKRWFPIIPFLLLLLIVTIVIQGCRKISQEANAKEDQAARFFEQKGTVLAQLQPVIADLKKKQGNKDFVSKLVSKAGYPQWNHSKLTKKKSNLAARGTSESESDTTYLYTPFTVDEYQNVQAILITRQVGDALSYKFMLADYYRDFPNYPSAEGGNATATDVAMLFMAFELEVFGHNRMRIKDHDKLFLLSEEQQDAGQFVQNVALARGQGDITSVIVSAFSVTYCWEVWYDPDGDDDPCDCSGNEYYDHDDCETIYFGGGGVGNPSTPDDPTPSQPNTPGPADGGGYIGGGFDYPGGQTFTEDPEPDIHNYHNQGPVATLSGWEPELVPEENNSTALPLWITDSLTTPCFKTALQRISGGTQNTFFRELYDIFDTSYSLFVEIKELDSISGAYAHTFPPSQLPSWGDYIKIELNKKDLKKCSQEYISYVLMHETVHAAMFANVISWDTTNSQHESMITKYLDKMATSLTKTYTSLPLLDAYSICYWSFNNAIDGNAPSPILLSIMLNKIKSKLNMPGLTVNQLLQKGEAYTDLGTKGKRSCN